MLHDVRLALRRCRFRPASTATMILIIALGIGAATAVFSVVDQTILRPPPFAHPDRLVQVMDVYRSAGARSTNLTLEKIAGWQQQRALFEALEGYSHQQADLTADGIEPERVSGFVVTTGLFRMLGVQPSLGRGFADTDGRPASDRVVIISERLWKTTFAGRSDVLGTEVALSGDPHTIIGIMPRRFRLAGNEEDLWLPVHVDNRTASVRAGFVGLARLDPGVDPSSRQKLADTLAADMQAQTPLPSEPFWDIHLEPKKVAGVAETTRTALFVLLGAVGFVLLITCANTASLFLAQLGMRRRETAVRAAIGASRRRLFRQVLIESLVLAGCGGVVGILLATWGVDAIVAAAPSNLTFHATRPIEVDGRIAAVAALMAMVTGVVFGLAPAFRGSRPNVELILKSGTGRGSGRFAQGGLSSALVVAEVAFSLILLTGAALMVRTFANLHALEPGFDPRGTIAVSLSLPTDKYIGEGARSAFFESLRERLAQLPGVSDVAVASQVFGGAGITFVKAEDVDGRAPDAPAGRIHVPSNSVTAAYFHTLRIPLVEGRTFDEEDDEHAVVISRSLARRLWPDGGVLGRRFRLDPHWPWQTVIGVAGDVEARAGDLRTPHHLYRQFARPSTPGGPPPRTRGYAGRVVLVRAADAGTVIPVIRAAVWALDRNQPIGRVAFVEDLYGDAFARERFVLQLMAAFAAIALVLTAAGIFGVLSQVVATRTPEIGVRVALGAQSLDVVRLVASKGAIAVAIGTALGLGGAVALSRFLEALLFQVRPLDSVSFFAVTLVMISVAALACWLPTRRAIHVDPAAALRVEA